MKIKTIALFVLILSTVISAQSKNEKMDEVFSKYHELGLFNGSILVAENGKSVFEKGYGFANMEFEVPNKPDTKFRIGSISKQFTATVILQLVEEGKIDLEAPITKYLTDYRKDTGDKVTIHQLLNHTSGIQSYTSIPGVWPDSLRNHYTKEYFIENFHSGDFDFEPGTEFRYNNTGYYLLAAIAEEVTGEKFGDLLKTRILDKVGMTNTGSEDSETVINNAAQGYLKRGYNIYKDIYFYMPNAMGAGHMYSTVRDLFKWYESLKTELVLSSEMKAKAFTPYKSNYGYGWVIARQLDDETGDSLTIISHGGGINGFITLGIYIKEYDIFVAAFSNAGVAPLQQMAQTAGQILRDEEYEFPKQPIDQYLAEYIEEDGIESAVELYKALKEEEESSFDFSEGLLNRLGYFYLNEGKIDEAIAIFKLNIEAYPKSGNTYDSLGEAFMVKGDNDKAIELYKKSIEINPANENGKKKLKELGVDLETEKVTVSAEILKSYEGTYELMPNFTIEIRAEENQLFAKATSQPEFEIFPKSEFEFYYTVVNAQIEFIVNEGVIEKLILFQNGQEMHAPKK